MYTIKHVSSHIINYQHVSIAFVIIIGVGNTTNKSTCINFMCVNLLVLLCKFKYSSNARIWNILRMDKCFGVKHILCTSTLPVCYRAS